ncbi:hypothetical protein GCM10008085_09210 [Winogradskyella epiphytica]|nr:hypothetical protein GCM10008085_09210 [Winogradskyella epiphytica]
MVISLKSVTTEADDIEDFEILKLNDLCSFKSACKDRLKIDSDQRYMLVLS